MDNFSLSVIHWCSLKDGIQSGSCLPLVSKSDQQIDEATVLAGKKLRNIDAQTINMLCCFSALSQTTTYEPHAAMVSATSMGAFDSVCKLLTESRLSTLPHQISPGNIPNTVINSTAGMSAIHYGFDGPNISLCASELSFYEALTKAFALGRCSQTRDIFVSALESWEGLYGRALNNNRQNSSREVFPQQCYAALFMFSVQPEAEGINRILAVTTGRLHQREQLGDKLASFLFSHGLVNSEIDQINLWDARQQSEVVLKMFPYTTLTTLSTSARVLMSGLGAWQLEQLLSSTNTGKIGVQLAIDADGFYGIAVIKKASN